jgi:myosin protein heavy chain
LAAEARDLHRRLDAEIGKSYELADTLALYKIRAEQATEKLEAAEMGRLKAEKNEGLLKINVNELQESLDLSLKAKQAVEDLSKGQEERIVDLQDKIEDQTHDLGDLIVAKKKLQKEKYLRIKPEKNTKKRLNLSLLILKTKRMFPLI